MHTDPFRLGDIVIHVDKQKTAQLYAGWADVTEECSCDDCAFYASFVVQLQLEFLAALKKMRVDLRKNVGSDPSGANATPNTDYSDLIWCSQLFAIVGHLDDPKKTYTYKKEELGYVVHGTLYQKEEEQVWAEVTITPAGRS